MDIKFLILVIASLHFLLGILVLSRRRDHIKLSFAVFVWFTALWSASLYFYEHPLVFSSLAWIKIVYFFVIVLIGSLFYFSFVFPVKPEKTSKWPLTLYSGLGLVFVYLLFGTKQWVWGVVCQFNQCETLLGPVYVWFGILCAIFIVWTLVNFVQKYRNNKGIQRMQLMYLFLGLALTVVPVLFVDVLLPVVFNNSSYFWLSPFSPLAMIICLAYAITRYRLMDIRLVLKKSGVFLLALIIVVGLTIFAIWLMAYLMNYRPNPILMVGGAIAMAIIILLFIPLRSFLQKLADKLLFRKITSYQKALKELSDKIVATIDLDKIVNSIVETTKNTMGLERAGVLLRDEATGQYKIQKIIGFKEENGISLVRDNFLTEHLQKTRRPLVYEELKLMMRDAQDEQIKQALLNLRDNMKRIEAVLCLPLMIKDKLEGIVVLGRKLSEDAYSREDLEVLEILINQTSIAIENARLYDQVKDLSENLQEKVDEQTKSLKELLAMKTEFLNTVSHQLRTPTTIFRSMLSMITEGDISGKQKEEWIKDSYGAANRLLIVIEGILEANTFEGRTPSFDFKLIDLEQVLQEAVKIFPNIAQRKGVMLEYQKPEQKLPQIMADARWLKSAFVKVIDNAIWYTRKNGKVVVKCQSSNNKVQIIVQDTGIGLTQDDKKILFQKFQRGRGSLGMNVNSSGLGLYIAKRIVQGHSGEITAESEGEDKGSVFMITLPIMQEI